MPRGLPDQEITFSFISSITLPRECDDKSLTGRIAGWLCGLPHECYLMDDSRGRWLASLMHAPRE